MPTEDKTKISAYTRERHIRKDPLVTIVTSSTKASTEHGPIVGIEDILQAGFPSTVSERLDRALNNVHKLTPHPGAYIRLKANDDYSVLFADTPEAFSFFRNSLENQGWIVKDAMDSSAFTLSVQGWNRIAELERQRAKKDSRQVFVAMSFDNSLDKAYREGIERAIEDAGYKPLRVDLKEHNEKICDVIVAEIRKSCFMIADFTGHRAGVYFEAGFAKGLGLEVIWTCQEDSLEQAHFDTRQYNHIPWKNEQDLYEKLRRRIEATIPSRMT